MGLQPSERSRAQPARLEGPAAGDWRLGHLASLYRTEFKDFLDARARDERGAERNGRVHRASVTTQTKNRSRSVGQLFCRYGKEREREKKKHFTQTTTREEFNKKRTNFTFSYTKVSLFFFTIILFTRAPVTAVTVSAQPMASRTPGSLS